MQSMERIIAEYDNRANRNFDFDAAQILEIMKLSQDSNQINALFAAVTNALKAGYVIGAKQGAAKS